MPLPYKQWIVPLTMTESRRYREETHSSVIVKADTPDEALRIVRAKLDQDPDYFMDSLDWGPAQDPECVGCDIVDGPVPGEPVEADDHTEHYELDASDLESEEIS